MKSAQAISISIINNVLQLCIRVQNSTQFESNYNSSDYNSEWNTYKFAHVPPLCAVQYGQQNPHNMVIK